MKKTLYSLLIIIYLIVINSNIALSQDSDSIYRDSHKIGLFYDFNINQNYGNFRNLPGIPTCCPKYESGYGTGFTLGLIYETPQYDFYSLQFRPYYASLSGNIVDDQPEWLNFNGTKINGTFEHVIDTKINAFGIELMNNLELFDYFRLMFGLNMGFYTNSEFTHKEQITEPGYGTFVDTGTRLRNVYSGTIPDATSVYSGLIFGARYDFPLNRNRSLILSPELSYTFGLTHVIKDTTWHINMLRFGVSILYSIQSNNQKIEEKPIQEEKLIIVPKNEPKVAIETLPAPKVKESKLIAKVDAFGIKDGKETPEKDINIEEFLSTNMKPLLNYVFFDNNSSDIPRKYSMLKETDTKLFSVDKLFNVNTLDTYYEILNIVGYRMNLYPKAKITLTGCNSNVNEEKDNLLLSEQRAKNIAYYLIKNWRIDKNRIIIKSRNLPEKPSRLDDNDGIEENRRVEISSDNFDIIAPVITNDTLREINPPVVRFYLTAIADTIKHWNLKIYQNSKVIYSLGNYGNPPKKIDVNILDSLKLNKFSKTIDYTFEIVNGKGENSITPQASLPVKQRTLSMKREEKTNDKKIDKYSLILFDFDEYRLNSMNKNIMNIIKPKISDNSTIDIKGYTDRMGDSEHNLYLSKNRAKELLNYLKFKDVSAEGLGESVLLFNNDLPEGRFYCRTVDVIVETPINW